MSPSQTIQREERPAAREMTEERRPAVGVLAQSALPECTCPGDCDRDHDNE